MTHDGEALENQPLSNRQLGAVSARGAMLLLVSQAVVFAANFVGIVILARSLSPELFGLMAMAATVTNFIMLFRDFGLTAPILQRAQLSHAQLSGLYWINVAFGVVLTVSTVLMAPAVAWFYDQEELTLLISVLASGFLIGTTGAIQDALLRRNLRFGAIATIRIAAALITLVAGVSAAWLGFGIWALVIMRLVQQAVLGMGAWMASRWRPGWYQHDSETLSLLGMAGNVSATQFTNYFSRNADNILVGWYWGGHALGLYDQAHKLLVLPMQQLGQPLHSVLLPLLSRLADKPASYRAVYRRVTEKVVMLTMPLTCVMLVLPEEVVRVAFGPKWLDAAPIVAWFGIAMIYQPLAFTTGCLLISQNRSGLLLRNTLISAVVSIASFVIGLPYGPAAVAAAYVISGALIRLPLTFWQVGREGPVSMSDQYRMLIPPLWSGAVLASVFFALKFVAPLAGNPFLLLFVAAVVTVPTTCAALFLLPMGRSLMRDSVEIMRLALSGPRTQ